MFTTGESAYPSLAWANDATPAASFLPTLPSLGASQLETLAGPSLLCIYAEVICVSVQFSSCVWSCLHTTPYDEGFVEAPSTETSAGR